MSSKHRIDPYVIPPQATIRDAMACIDRNGKGIALVVDPDMRLLGSVTDGDIRRAILRGGSLDVPVQELVEERKKSGRRPITGTVETTDAELLRLMNLDEIRQIPVLDADGKIVRIAFLTDFTREYEAPMSAVVMAGGFGKRLQPLTDNMPKPMLPIGDRPMLQWTIEQLKKSGINQISLTTFYKPEAISSHFGNGSDFGVAINYVQEDQPLGTAGALGLLHNVDGPLLVMNGDILTKVDFRAMLAYHKRHNAKLTVAVRRHEIQVPFGVVECEGEQVARVSEKPQLRFLVNAGIYLLEPSVLQYIPAAQNFDMPDLISRLVAEQQTVVSFPILEYWLDIGRHADYQTAQDDVRNGRMQ